MDEDWDANNDIDDEIADPEEIIDAGPPPGLKRRGLIFDSLRKISEDVGAEGACEGTYCYSWGAGYHGQLGLNLQRGQKKYSTCPRFVFVGCGVRRVTCD
eukprot:302294_1